MKWVQTLKTRLAGLIDAVSRFPLTTLFLAGAAIYNTYLINARQDDTRLLFTFIFGAFLSAALQVAYERFFSRLSARFAFMGAAVLLTGGYYLIVQSDPSLNVEVTTRTAVALFALLIAFIWVPVIRSRISFNQSFMIAFKSFFHSLFFAGIIYIGISIIVTAFSSLIFSVDSRMYAHSANMIFIIFAPIYFLSLIPVYPGAGSQQESMDAQEETIHQAAHCPKFLEVLISYIIIPLIAVFTLILIAYILKNIGGEFWTDNLLEPMLVAYAITVILVYILASEIENKFTVFFRNVFPKVLVPIVLFQIASSIVSTADTGITYTRYYAILFGLFAAAAGVVLSLLPVRKNGIIAAMLIAFATISVVPPVDAFTISRNNQIHMLEQVLVKNNMLENNNITPNESISDEDKRIITETAYYLQMMGYTKDIAWLPDDFDAYNDFQRTFGFPEYQEQSEDPGNMNESVYLSIEQPAPITITGSDIFVQVELNMPDSKADKKVFDMKKDGKQYILLKEFNKEQTDLTVIGENEERLLSFNTEDIYKKFYDYNGGKGFISAEDATFIIENDRAKMTIVVQNVGIEKQNPQYNNAMLFVFVQIK